MDSLIPQIVENFKASYGLKITDSSDMLLTERNLLEFLMKLGRGVMGKVFEGMDKGYEGAVVNKEGRKYKFVGYRTTSLHGLLTKLRERGQEELRADEKEISQHLARSEDRGSLLDWLG